MPKKGSSLLPDTTIRSTEAKTKVYMLRDGDGLWFVVEPTGRRWWKPRVVFAKKENSFSLGDYPEVSPAQDRERKDHCLKQIATGVDPSVL